MSIWCRIEAKLPLFRWRGVAVVSATILLFLALCGACVTLIGMGRCPGGIHTWHGCLHIEVDVPANSSWKMLKVCFSSRQRVSSVSSLQRPGGCAVARGENPAKVCKCGFPLCRHALLPHCWSSCADANYLTLFWTTDIEMDMLKAQVLGASWRNVNRCTLTLTKEICEICFPFRSHAPDCSAMFSKLCSTPHFTCLCSLLVVFVTCFLLFLCDIRLQLRNDVDCCHSLVQ